MKVATDRPPYCSVCYGTDSKVRYIDFEVAHDGAPVLDPESGGIAWLPWTGTQPSNDDLYICESCLQQATELLGLKPELRAAFQREIHSLKLEGAHWKRYAKDLEESLQGRPEPAPSPRRKVKVAA